MIRRLAGVLYRPRTTLTALHARPVWAGTWFAILTVWTLCGAWLLSTDIGPQALIDERVRAVEAFGGSVSDDQYQALQASPPVWVYLTSGGRILLTPPVTLAAAAALWMVSRRARAGVQFVQALAIAVHVSVVLLVGQLIATPLDYLRETLTSPINLAAVLPLMQDGTLPARIAGAVDVFGLWWVALLALGLSVLTGRRPDRYVWPVTAAYVGIAAILAVVTSALGGS